MKKYLTLFFALFLSLSSFSSHLEGGQIFWEALGNDQYIFHVQLIRHDEPNSHILPSSILIENDIPNFGNIAVSRRSIESITKYCFEEHGRHLEIHSYSSNIVTISAPPQGTRYRFTYQECCRADSSAINVANLSQTYFFIDSYMWSTGANKSSGYFNLKEIFRNSSSNVIKLHGIPGRTDSTLTFSMAQTLDSAGVITNYTPGFDRLHPTSQNDTLLPDGTFIAGNTDSSYLSILSFGATHPNIGSSGFQSYVRLTTGFNFIDSLPTMNEPQYSLTASSNTYYVQNPSGAFITSTEKLDTLSFDFVVRDTSSIRGIGDSLIVYLGHSPFYNTAISKPVLLPINGSNQLNDTGSISFRFEWIVPADLPKGNHRFIVNVENNSCPANGINHIPIHIFSDDSTQYLTSLTCRNHSVTLEAPRVTGATYQWLPTTFLTNSNTRRPTCTPDSSISYVCLINGDSVLYAFVNVQPNNEIQLNAIPNGVSIANSQDYRPNPLLLYYNIAVETIQDTFVTKTTDGIYSMIADDSLGCYHTSQTWTVQDTAWIEHTFSPRINTWLYGNPVASYDVSISIQPTQGNFQELHQIVFPGLYEDPNQNSSFGCMLIVNGSGNQVGTATPYGNRSTIVTFSPPIDVSGKMLNFQFSMSGYRGTQYVVTGPLSTPDVQFIPQGSSGGYVVTPMVLRGKNGVGLNEPDAMSVEVYPQPASDWLAIKNIELEGEYRILDMSGKGIMRGLINPQEKISIAHIPSGTYILEWNNGESVHRDKVQILH